MVCLDKFDIVCLINLMSIELRNKIGRDEFDYQVLMSALSGYASPRDRVTSLLRSGTIIRVKKGLYVFGKEYRRQPISNELLANLISGPSFVSLDYALSYYGLIPERVEIVTSVTSKRAKRFNTPVGRFVYRPTSAFSIGIDRAGPEDRSFFIAVPERAVADRLRDDRGGGGRTKMEIEKYLFEDLRLYRNGMRELSANFMYRLADALRSRKVRLCADVMRDSGGK